MIAVLKLGGEAQRDVLRRDQDFDPRQADLDRVAGRYSISVTTNELSSILEDAIAAKREACA